MSLKPGVPESRIGELQSMGQGIIEAELGDDTGLRGGGGRWENL